jgi:tRNA-2-methylthio-N6-dimethylallyladenosine synthase
MGDQVEPHVMDERLQRLQALLGEQQLAFNRATVGRSCEVLIERKGKLPGQMLGKSPWLQSVLIDGGEIGDLVEVEITAAGPQSMNGERVQRQAA